MKHTRRYWDEFVPKFFIVIRKYTFGAFCKDFVAGVTVGIVALPLAMAFGIASGVSPDRGLYTAIIAGFLISFLGGSHVQIGGPTGAFVAVVYDVVTRQGYEGLVLATILASILLVLIGLFRLGTLIKYIPYPLVTGFTAGIAVLIFSTQVKDFFGLQVEKLPADFIDKWIVYFHTIPTWDPKAVGVGGGTLLLILLMRRFAPVIPWGIFSIVCATIVTVFFQIPVETIQSRFGEISRSLPLPSFPSMSISLEAIISLMPDAITIAFLAGVESLLSAVIGDGMTGGRHKSNCELVAQGIANFGSVVFGGIPATGAIARTATNIKTGARTPVAGMIHALTLFLIISCFSPIVSKIPLPSIAAVLMMVAWNMSEARQFRHLFKAPSGDIAILLTAFFLTVLIDITVAVEVGVILAALLFMKRIVEISHVAPVAKLFEETVEEYPEDKDPDAISKKNIPHGVEVYEIDGPFFFGIADRLKAVLHNIEFPPKIFILRMRKVPFIDATGMHALKEFYLMCEKDKTYLLLCEVRGDVAKTIKQYGLQELINSKHIFPHINGALRRARELLESK